MVVKQRFCLVDVLGSVKINPNTGVQSFWTWASGIYFDSDNLFNLQKIINKELNKVRKWLEANRLALNIYKTNYVIFHSRTNKVDSFVRIKLSSKPISRVNCIKYLGVLIDSTLSWKPHIVELSKKLAKTSGIFYKIRHYVPSETSVLLFILFSYNLCYISLGPDSSIIFGSLIQDTAENC